MDPELVDRLRADLLAAGYRLEAVRALLGETADGARERGVFAPARIVLAKRDPSPLAALVRVFLLGEAVPAAVLDAALLALGSSGALELGLLREAETGGLCAAFSLNPVETSGPLASGRRQWWILSDLDDQLRRGPARPDHVMGVGGATRSLLEQAPVSAVERALDLGTGCGVVAMHLAGVAHGSVVATDISSRALVFARANARLNGLDGRIEFRQGDLFDPVRGERFDLILSNPPFVITPRGADAPVYAYRDGGLAGDELAERVISRAPAHLRESGTLLCLANWESPWGERGIDRVRGWIRAASDEAGPLDGWVIERDRVDPAVYAETWVRDGGARPGSPEFEGLMAAWLDDFARRRIVAIGLGSVRVRRAAHGNGAIRCETAAGPFCEAPGSGLQAAFDAGTAAAAMDDASVLASRWELSGAVVEEREHRPGEESPRAIALVVDRPIARRVAADTLLAAAAGACDGELTLGQIARALATLLDIDAGAAGEALAAGARELAWLGMLAPSRASSGSAR